MSTKFYIGTELADFDELFNVMYSIGDIRDIAFGNSNKSYTLDLPLTKQNKRLLKFISQADVKSELSEKGRLYLDELLNMQGAVQVSGCTDHFAKVILNSDDWIDELNKKKMTDLDLSAHDHALTHAVVEDSWTAAYPFYRYPMISFGALASGQTGTTAKWYPNDFIPMFSVSQLITKILSPYTISSAWLATAFIKDLYILARETIAPDSFIIDKALEVKVNNETDNLATGTSADPFTVILEKSTEFYTIITDEGNDFGLHTTYTIPETGTYRFIFTAKMRNTAYGNGLLTITNEHVTIEIKKNGTAIATTSAPAYVATELIDDITYTVDSKYYHFTTGDTVTCRIYLLCAVTPTESVTVELFTNIISNFVNIWNNVNKHSGLNKNISAEEMLPNISQLDFLSAIRDIFNLRFFLDKFRQVPYIEPWDKFLSSTVIDLTDYIDFESIETELISKNYSKNIIFKWKDDTSDFAYTEYLKTATSPGQKELTLDSLYAKAGTDIKESFFSSIVTGIAWAIPAILPRIWAEVIDNFPIIFNRKVGFNTRIVEWKGLTAGFTWHYETEEKTTYPKIQGLDFTSLYTNYLMKFFHYIDKGKLFTVRMKLRPGMLTEFLTVVNIAGNEGFRPTYCIEIAGIKNYFALQKITSDGERAEIELILKQ